MTSNRTYALTTMLVLAAAGLAGSAPARADEGGVSFWLPGQFGSLAATPNEPGWSVSFVYYHASADAGGSVEIPAVGVLTLGLNADLNLLFVTPSYVLATPVLGGQATVSMAAVFGRADVIAGGTLTIPGGPAIPPGRRSDDLTAFGDLYPSGSLRWNDGNHNGMAYVMAGVPVGSYEVGRLANIGVNHWSVDLGGGYTYLDAKKGRELSAVAGFTYNFENPDTNYKNGVDLHLDLGVSQFLSAKLHVGAVGYAYYQITGDSGSGAILGEFKSRVFAAGPQVGYLFQTWGRQAYVALKAYWEFGAEHRLEGWNGWVVFALPIGGK